MHRLILLRHAKTEPWSDSLDDHSRGLTLRGKADAALMANEFLSRGWRIDAGLVSTARRARETWRIVLDSVATADTHLEDDLYLAGPELIQDVMGRHPSPGTLCVVGHNPGLHEAACELARQCADVSSDLMRRLVDTYPTGCASLFQREGETRLRLIDVIHPKQLRPADNEFQE